MHKRLYGFADVGRYGLAHSLLAWARCKIWCKENDVKTIAPIWRRIRLGPYLRGERDKREYYKLFNDRDSIGGLKRFLLLAISRRVNSEHLNIREMNSPFFLISVFKNKYALNDETHFREISSHSDFIRQSLVKMTKRNLVPLLDSEPHISVHVRMGDFVISDGIEGVYSRERNVRIPIEWYCTMVRALRSRTGYNLRVRVYSDGTDESLNPLMALGNASRAVSTSAVTDMLAMGHASVLISSGSGFSRWGSYLYQTPRICCFGQRVCRVLSIGDIELEPECKDGDDIPQEFVDLLRKRIESSASDRKF